MLFGLKIQDYYNWETLYKDLRQRLKSGKKTQVVTLNPEMIVCASRDDDFLNILKKTLLIPDGIGISIANRMLNGFWLNRYPGVDIMEKMLEGELFKDYSFYFFGASKKSIINLIKKIKTQYHGIKIAGYHYGEISEIQKLKAFFGFQHQNNFKNTLQKYYATSRIIREINDSNAEILFVALGSSLQEKWIYYNLSKMISVKLAIGVGGAFDMLSRMKPRAPLFLRKIGLEWLWRLILQPARFRRIYNATIRFSLLIIKEAMNKKRKADSSGEKMKKSGIVL